MATTGEINGSILKLFTDAAGTYTTLGNILSCSIKGAVDMIDVTSKSSGGNKAFIAGEFGWTASVEMVMEEDGSVGGSERSYSDVLTILTSKASQTIAWGSGVSGDLKITGSGYFMDFEFSAPNNDKATCTFSIQGTAAMTVGTFA